MRIRTAVILAIILGPLVVYGADNYGETGASSVPSAATPKTMDAGDSKLACKEKWKRYRASQACFAPYRLADGGLKAEAFKHCKQIRQPEFCE